MKRFSSVFLIIGSVLIFFGCQHDNPTDPKLNQSNQAPTSLAIKPAPSLSGTIDYVFVGHLGTFDAEGRRLVWDGEIHGDIDGQILWWFVPNGGPPDNPEAPKHVSFYEARWEIWNGDWDGGGTLLLAGESAGTTALNLAEPRPHGKDGIWRGNGTVTEASEPFEAWNGRQMVEGGNVNWTFPFSGEGIFRIN